MTAVAVDEHFIGAGQVYLDDVLVGSTREDNVFRVMQEVAAPTINGVGGMLARTDYHTRLPWAELELTLVELSDELLAVMIPGAIAAAGSGADAGKTVITGPDQAARRLGTADYHKWLLAVPGIDGALIELEIALGIAQSNAEFTAADSENPLGPRITIQSRIDPDAIETPQWRILRTAAGS
jgi:hypothetical protein